VIKKGVTNVAPNLLDSVELLAAGPVGAVLGVALGVGIALTFEHFENVQDYKQAANRVKNDLNALEQNYHNLWIAFLKLPYPLTGMTRADATGHVCRLMQVTRDFTQNVNQVNSEIKVAQSEAPSCWFWCDPPIPDSVTQDLDRAVGYLQDMNAQYAGIVGCSPHCSTAFTDAWVESMDDDLFQTCSSLKSAICHFPDNLDQCFRQKCRHFKNLKPQRAVPLAEALSYTQLDAFSGADTSGTASQCISAELVTKTTVSNAPIPMSDELVAKTSVSNASISMLRCTAKMLDDEHGNLQNHLMWAKAANWVFLGTAIVAWLCIPTKSTRNLGASTDDESRTRCESVGSETGSTTCGDRSGCCKRHCVGRMSAWLCIPMKNTRDLVATTADESGPHYEKFGSETSSTSCGDWSGCCKQHFVGRYGTGILLMMSSFFAGTLVTFQVVKLSQCLLLQDMSTWLTGNMVDDLSDLRMSQSDANVLQTLDDLSTLIGMVAIKSR